jgi:hypothetical protein
MLSFLLAHSLPVVVPGGDFAGTRLVLNLVGGFVWARSIAVAVLCGQAAKGD